jgi:predicted TIM-barrel fold metal-dependent hydrolase
MSSGDKRIPAAPLRPRPKLVVESTSVEKPRFPVVEAHNHLGAAFGGGWENRPFEELLARLDEAGVVHLVDLDGGWGEDILASHLDAFKAKAPDRFSVFGGVDWSRWAEEADGFGEWAAGRLEAQKARGATGLKIWKPLGLIVRDHRDVLVKVDDSRLDPVWQAAAELGLPVLIHVADPVAFFDPVDETNERWDELHEHPEWAWTSPPFPAFREIVDGLARLVARHPRTTFIGAHVGCYAENLVWVSDLLDRCPNFHVDIADRIAELGRQPYSARRFFLEHADRILFGTDLGPDPEKCRIYYRFLETRDEFFNPEPGETTRQGRWYVHGLGLPDDVLEKVYFANAARVLGLRV